MNVWPSVYTDNFIYSPTNVFQKLYDYIPKLFSCFFGYILYTVVKCYNRPRFARVSNPLRFSQFVSIRGGSNHAEILTWEEKNENQIPVYYKNLNV